MELLDILRQAWGFAGLVPSRVIEVNDFGNVLVEDVDGRIWRVRPEELSCEQVAATLEKAQDLRASIDWTMAPLVARATARLGAPGDGRCFCLKTPAALGGKYEEHNMGTITLAELIAASGDMAEQIKDLPDGAQIRLEVVD